MSCVSCRTRAAVRSSTSHLSSATRVFLIWRCMWPASTLSSASRTAALEAAPFGVRVNAVGPGYIDTAMFARVMGSPDNQAAVASTIPQGRAGRPEEVADAIMYLAGPQATYLTGQTLFLDGGVKASWPVFSWREWTL